MATARCSGGQQHSQLHWLLMQEVSGPCWLPSPRQLHLHQQRFRYDKLFSVVYACDARVSLALHHKLMHISTCADDVVSSDAAVSDRCIITPQHFRSLQDVVTFLVTRATMSMCEKLLPQYNTWARNLGEHKELYDSKAGKDAAWESQNIHLRIVL